MYLMVTLCHHMMPMTKFDRFDRSQDKGNSRPEVVTELDDALNDGQRDEVVFRRRRRGRRRKRRQRREGFATVGVEQDAIVGEGPEDQIDFHSTH